MQATEHSESFYVLCTPTCIAEPSGSGLRTLGGCIKIQIASGTITARTALSAPHMAWVLLTMFVRPTITSTAVRTSNSKGDCSVMIHNSRPTHVDHGFHRKLRDNNRCYGRSFSTRTDVANTITCQPKSQPCTSGTPARR